MLTHLPDCNDFGMYQPLTQPAMLQQLVDDTKHPDMAARIQQHAIKPLVQLLRSQRESLESGASPRDAAQQLQMCQLLRVARNLSAIDENTTWSLFNNEVHDRVFDILGAAMDLGPGARRFMSLLTP